MAREMSPGPSQCKSVFVPGALRFCGRLLLGERALRRLLQCGQTLHHPEAEFHEGGRQIHGVVPDRQVELVAQHCEAEYSTYRGEEGATY